MSAGDGRILFVTGTKIEAALLPRGTPCICSGMRPDQTRSRLASRLGSDIRAVISFGFAGGLDPSLAAGDLILADRVVREQHEEWTAPADIRSRLAAAIPAAKTGLVLGTDRLLACRKQKAALLKTTGAETVDMESHIVAECAQVAGLPWAVIRAVSDPADADLPPAAQCGVRADGGIAMLPILAAVVRRPTQLPHLVALWHNSRSARDSLEAAIAALEAGLR